MRKLAVTFTLFSYLLASHYCLAYALVTGNVHHPAVELALHQNQDPDHDEAHEHCPGHGHKDDSKSDDCCVTFSCESPALLPGHIALTKPAFVFNSLLLPNVDLTQDIQPESYRNQDTGPPGPYQDVCLIAPSLRAPPANARL